MLSKVSTRMSPIVLMFISSVFMAYPFMFGAFILYMHIFNSIPTQVMKMDLMEMGLILLKRRL